MSSRLSARRAISIASALLTLGMSVPPDAARAETGSPVFITLGTGGGPVIRTNRSQPANALVVNNAVYLIDIGAGTQRQLARAGLDPQKVRAIFLSHHHVDHVSDLGPFLFNRWLLFGESALPVIGPPGTVAMVDGLIRAARPIELAPVTIGGPAKLPVGATVLPRDLSERMDSPDLIYKDENIRVFAVTNNHYHFEKGSAADHFSRSFAFRIETYGKIYVYTGDTGWSEKVVRLAKNADVLISEVIDIPGVERALRADGHIPEAAMLGLLAHMQQDHLTPRQVGEIAKLAGVKAVVLTHLVPGDDLSVDLSVYSAGVTQIFHGPVKVAADLDRF